MIRSLRHALLLASLTFCAASHAGAPAPLAPPAAAPYALTPWLLAQKTMPADQATAQIHATDCSVDEEKCRYFAAVESLVFAQECKDAIPDRLGQAKTPEDRATEAAGRAQFGIQIELAIAGWKELAPAPFKSAVLADSPYKAQVAAQLRPYLHKIPMDDLGIECSRIGMMQENHGEALDASDTLRSTKNFAAWDAARQPARQAAFDADQRKASDAMAAKRDAK